MDSDTRTGSAIPAGKSIRVVNHLEGGHKFCSKCGFCVDCSDCDIWGCGRKHIYEETDE